MRAPHSEPAQYNDADGLPLPRRRWAIFALVLAVAITVLDTSIVNIALPLIATDLQISPASAVWVINAYQLTVTVLLLPLASLGEVIGYRRVHMAGLAIFTLASLACAIADSLPALIAARVMQGLGGAGIMSVNVALVRFIYPNSQLGRGIGINALVVAVSASLGPTLGAGVLHLADWPWLFAINVPLGALSLLIAIRAMPASPLSGHAFDAISAALSVLALGLLILGIDEIGHGRRLHWVLLGLSASATAGWFLVRRQLTLPSPLLPIDLLKIPVFALSIGASLCAFMAQTLAFISLPFYFQGVLGRSAVETGLLITPWPLAVGVLALLAGRLVERYSAGLLGSVGLMLFALGLTSMALLPEQVSDLDIALRMSICGVGFGLFQTPNNRTIMNSAPRRRSGGASGMLSTGRLLGQTLGAALVAIIFSVTAGPAMPAALTTAAVLAALAALASGLRLTRTAPA